MSKILLNCVIHSRRRYRCTFNCFYSCHYNFPSLSKKSYKLNKTKFIQSPQKRIRMSTCINSDNGDSHNNNNNNIRINNHGSDGSNLIIIDGSIGEGGGQILRNSISLAGIMKKNVHIQNIRANRSKPGLKAQHVTSLKLIQHICNGQLMNNDLNSTQVTYQPHKQQQQEEGVAPSLANSKNTKTIIGDTGTAGSICLLLQAALPCALFSSSTEQETVKINRIESDDDAKNRLIEISSSSLSSLELILKGGTNASMAPQYDYWERVFLPIFQKHFLRVPSSSTSMTPAATTTYTTNCLDNNIQPKVIKRGYFPKGGGEVHVKIHPLASFAKTISTTTENFNGDNNDKAKQEQLKLPLHSINLIDRGTVSEIYIRSFHAGKLPKHLAHDMAKSAKSYFIKNYDNSSNDDKTLNDDITNNNDDDPMNTNNNNKKRRNNNISKNNNHNNSIKFSIDIVTEKNAVGNGMGIIIIATTTTGCILAGSALGGSGGGSTNNHNRFKKAKDIGIEAAKELCLTLNDGGCVDEWLQDQLILYMALANGTSSILTGSLTLHTQTAIWISEKLTGAKFTITKLNESEDCATELLETTGTLLDINSKLERDGDNVHVEDNPKSGHDEYGIKGRISGKHLVKCDGIGYFPASP